MRHITHLASLLLALLTSLAAHAQTGALHHSLQVTLDPSTSQISVTDADVAALRAVLDDAARRKPAEPVSLK